jgi:LuxR family maltose regulon positive regulatory protein
VLETSISDWESRGKRQLVMRGLAKLAVVRYVAGELDGAVTALEESLAIGAPEGYIRPFALLESPIADVLRTAVARGVEVEHAQRIVPYLRTRAAPPAVAEPADQAMVEPLSAREMEVLRLVSLGLSNQEIADELVIAIGTVKRHITNINGKLGVASRGKAVAAARDLGLIP